MGNCLQEKNCPFINTVKLFKWLGALYVGIISVMLIHFAVMFALECFANIILGHSPRPSDTFFYASEMLLVIIFIIALFLVILISFFITIYSSCVLVFDAINFVKKQEPILNINVIKKLEESSFMKKFIKPNGILEQLFCVVYVLIFFSCIAVGLYLLVKFI